ncbi:DUF2339 domain-containing protein [Acidicapsa ligni]|uniref:DUF2339 domain-containing protein n=1 Tax=Acidicapsa ligni TaxID=542300 RepID=UPI0021DFAFD8|nr:DUF2339 domain-containing protein [Acidicapsa ligni]
MTIILLVVLAFIALGAWISLRDQVKTLRDEFSITVARAEERLNRVEGRLRDLEAMQANAQATTSTIISGEEQGASTAPTSSTPSASVADVAVPVVPPLPVEETGLAARVAADIGASRLVMDAPVASSSQPSTSGSQPPTSSSRLSSTPEPSRAESSGAAQPTVFASSTFEMKPAAQAEHKPGLEERLGGNWLNKLGVALLVIGLAFFLALRLKTMGPGGKVLTGFAIGFAMLAGGVWLERSKQAYRIFARAGIGGGWALVFFTTYAMHHLAEARVIDSVVIDLILMLVVAAGMVAHSLLYKSQTVTGLAFGLAFATVAASHLESANGTVVFSLWASALLAVALVVVTTKRHWAWLEQAGLVAVYASHFLWLSLVRAPMSAGGQFALFWPSTALILFYWVLFRAAYLLRKPLDAAEDRISSLSAVLNAAGVLGLLKYQSVHPEWTFRALLAMGLIELALGVWARGRRRSAFVVLTTVATVLLVAAVPYKFHGVSWPVLWLVEAQVLAVCGLRLGEPVFRRLGLLAGFAAGGVLAVEEVFPLLGASSGNHTAVAVGLALAAVLYWVHGEVYPRRWPDAIANEIELRALLLTSWLGLAAAAAALWVILPASWVAIGWLGLVVALGVAADWKRVVSLALQADVLALFGIGELVFQDLIDAPHGVIRVPAAVGIVLLYAGMRRRVVPGGVRSYVAAGYSWAASLLLILWIGLVVDEAWLALAWVAPAIALFEIGRYCRKVFLRWQGFAAMVPACAVLLVHWTEHIFSLTGAHGWFSVGWRDVVSMLSVTALVYWLQERTRGNVGPGERRVGLAAGVMGTLIVAGWLPLLVPSWGMSESAAIVDAAWAVGLLGIALLVRREAFQVHGILIALGVGLYGISLVALTGQAQGGLPWWQGNLFRMGLAAAILLGGLGFAFRLRKLDGWSVWPEFARWPEQWFFFVAFGLMIVTLAVELRMGMWTLGWSLLGVGAFVFALLVGERSFRLGGLALLLVSVVKVLLIDVWALNPADRYTTLIGMGCALLLVSFLYTRFREVFRRYL